MSTPTTHPPITPRELSYHEATAGIAAREAAASSGGDPAQLRALTAAANAQDHGTPLVSAGTMPCLRGFPLRGDDLLVSLCFMLYAKVFGSDPRSQLATAIADSPSVEDRIKHREALAAMALIFTQPSLAWDNLDRAADPELSKDDAAGWARDFRRAAVDFAGDFGEEEMQILAEHVLQITRKQGRREEEDAPGK